MPERPNILIILSDQHNAMVMGAAGDPVVETPHLDALAASGTMFTAAYCASPLCVPSRATLLTGRHCSDIGVWTNHGQLNSGIPTFAHALRAAGYDTVLAGRMHFTGPDQRHGFDERLVGDISPPWGGHPGTVLEGLPEGSNRQSYPATATSGPGLTSYQAYDEAVTAAAVEWLAERARGPQQRPFCLVVGLILPHNPYIAPPELFNHYRGRVVDPQPSPPLHPAAEQQRTARRVGELTDAQIRSARESYYGLVSLLDSNLGEVLDAVRSNGLAENTATIYTSDHGDMIGDHGLWWKSSLYEGSVRVPLLASWPGKWAEDRRIDAPVSLLDLAPTVVALGGGAPLPNATGDDLQELLQRESRSRTWDTRPIFAENVPDFDGAPARMVRRGRWKLVNHHGYDIGQLFDLQADPDEHNDLGASAEHRDLRIELTELATRDWDGEAIRGQAQRQAADAQLIARWVECADPPDPDRWEAPPGCNQFDPA